MFYELSHLTQFQTTETYTDILSSLLLSPLCLISHNWCSEREYSRCVLYSTNMHAVAPLVDALRYKPRSRVSSEFFWPWGWLASISNEYHEYFLGGKGDRCVELTTLPSSCADYLEIWEP